MSFLNKINKASIKLNAFIVTSDTFLMNRVWQAEEVPFNCEIFYL